MNPVVRLSRPARSLLVVVLTTLVALALAVPAARAQDADVQPGVTLRVYDLGGVSLSELCTLRSGQTPNVDKYMPVIDYSAEADFEMSDNFISHTIADLVVPTDGEYTFRLTSDDGSRLSLDGEVVVDHDGLHGIDPPAEGSVALTAGTHELFLEHFEAGGGQQVTLEWQAPGATGFELVPTENLQTPSDVVRVTAPGTKSCEGATDTPGDGLRLDAVHPNYDLTDLRPEGFEPMVSSLAWDDDRLVLTTSGDVSPGGGVPPSETGELYVLDNVTGVTSADQVTVTKLADDLLNPMGVAVVDGTIYVSERDGLVAMRPDTDGDGLLEQEQLASWPFGGNFHEFAFGLLHEDGHFWVNLSVAIDAGGATTDPQPADNRGTTIKIDPDTGDVEYVASGLRTPNGMGLGPDGQLMVMDNQGAWLPSSKLLAVEQDRFFNHRTNPPGPFDDQPVTRPVLWLPQNEISNSPSNPVLLEDGPFAGQMLFGDVTYGGLQRAFLEEVDGVMQGAAFRHTAGLEAGVNRTIVGPDGDIYVGGIGEAGNWSEGGKLKYGLQKLSPNGTNAFDVQEMRATATGFEFTYTQPLSAETVDAVTADPATAYQVEQWTYSPSPSYGGPKIGEESLTPSAATVSGDATTVTLEIPGLKRNRVVHVRSPRPFTSDSGEQLWNTEAWYTLNEIPDDEQPLFHEAEEGVLDGGAVIATDHAAYSGDGFVASVNQAHSGTRFRVVVDEAGSYDLGVRYANGPNPFSGDKTMRMRVNGEESQEVVFPSTIEWGIWATQRERVELEAGANLVEFDVGPDSTGHVNLDAMTVRPAGERIQLMGDGADGLSEWQHTDGRAPEWPEVSDGVYEVCCGDLRTKEAFGDYSLHVEFWLPEFPPDVTGQARANSGVYQQERYEIQVLDSFGIDPLQDNDAAAIYTQKAADSNEATPPETWQTYDIDYTAARYDADGNKVANARVTVTWNGVVVHDDVEITGPTGGNLPEGPATGAIRLQDHGDPVRYRNVWIEPEYNAVPDLTATAEPTSGVAPLDVAFTASATDPEGTDVTYSWDFGDGSDTVTTADASHTYDTPGTYRASVTATDADGRSTGRAFTIDVDPDCSGDVDPNDEFEGDALDLCRWTEILREDTDHYRVTDGELQIDALDGDMHGGATNAANVILQDAPDTDSWSATTHVTLPQGEEYEQAGILVHQDDDNFAKLMLMDDPTRGWIAEFGQTVGGSAIHDGGLDQSAPLPDGINTDGVWLRVTSNGIGLTAAWSADGETWTSFGRTRPLDSLPDPNIGLAAYNGDGQAAGFDFFHVGDGGAPACQDPTTPEEGYRMLFDGTPASFDEWVMAGPGGFALQEDCSLLSQGGLGLLYHPDSFESYSLKLDWKLAGDDNGGVFVGFPNPGDDPWVAVDNGYEIQIDATDDPDSTTGAIYDFQAPVADARDSALNPPGEWNSYELVVTGDRVRVILNGVEVNDFTSTEDNRLDGLTHVGIQNHGGGDEVFYRDIQVMEVDTPDGPAPSLELTSPDDGATVDGDTVTVAGTTDGESVDVRLGTQLWEVTPTDGEFSVEVPVETGGNDLTVYAYAEDGTSTVATRSVMARNYGEFVGSLDDPAGDDDGPGSYVYPSNEVFSDGVFDLTGMEVYRDGDDYRFVVSIDGPVTNPSGWGGDEIALQRVNVYVGEGGGDAQAALPGTNMDTESSWESTVVIHGRFDQAGVWAPDGTKIADGELFAVPETNEFGVVVPASAFGDLDLDSAAYGTAMFIDAEGGEGIGNVRPVYSLEYWENPPAGMGYINEWRPGGGAGEWDSSPSHDTDTSDPNALDVIVGPGQDQSVVLDWTIDSPTQVPMLALDGALEPLTLDVSVDPADPDGQDGWYVSPVTVTATSTDDATIEFSVDGSEWVADEDGVLEVTADGSHTVEVRAVRGDETTEVETISIDLDGTAPEVDVDGITDGATVGSSDVVDVAVDATDATSGVAEVVVTVDGDEVASGDAPHSLSLQAWDWSLGEHVLTVEAVDVAGNSVVTEVTFTIETSLDDLQAHLDRLADQGELDDKDHRWMTRKVELAERMDDRGNVDAYHDQLEALLGWAERLDSADARDLLVRELEGLLDQS
nr:family 16 glycoside hydrolase [Salsipaludibacter albus]